MNWVLPRVGGLGAQNSQSPGGCRGRYGDETSMEPRPVLTVVHFAHFREVVCLDIGRRRVGPHADFDTYCGRLPPTPHGGREGKRANRPELAKALAVCRLHGARLVIAKLDRLSRNAHFLLGLKESGVDFVAADMPNANRLTVGIMAMVAEDEAERISQRTKDALAAAKRRGTKLGGFRGAMPTARMRKLSAEALRKRVEARVADLAPIIAELQAGGVTSLV